MAKKDVWPGAFAAYSAAWGQIKKNPGPAVLVIGAYALFSVVGLVLQGEAVYADPKHVRYENILGLVFLLALPTYGLAIADNRRISIAEFMKFNFKKYIAYFAAMVLTLLIVGVSLLLFIVPAIWTIAWFCLAGYAVVDTNKGPIEALRASKRLAQAHLSKIWGLIGVSVLLAVPAALLTFVPYVGDAMSQFFVVLSYGALALLYRWLQKHSRAEEA
jgi:hypothetical protein